jgi:DNA-binding NtrC family response regulator
VLAVAAQSAAVLVMDDEPGIRTATAELLGKAGHAVSEAASADQAFWLLREHRFDIAVVDYGMAGMSGREFARLAHKLQPELSLLFVTGNPEAVGTLLPQDRFRVLSKPFSHDDLLHAVSTATPPAVQNAIT